MQDFQALVYSLSRGAIFARILPHANMLVKDSLIHEIYQARGGQTRSQQQLDQVVMGQVFNILDPLFQQAHVVVQIYPFQPGDRILLAQCTENPAQSAFLDCILQHDHPRLGKNAHGKSHQQQNRAWICLAAAQVCDHADDPDQDNGAEDPHNDVAVRFGSQIPACVTPEDQV